MFFLTIAQNDALFGQNGYYVVHLFFILTLFKYVFLTIKTALAF